MSDPNHVALPKHDTVFMLLPKIANTSIKIALLKAQGFPIPGKVHKENKLSYVSTREAKQFTHRVAFVRDPLTRLASCYQDKIVEQSDGHFLPGLKKYGLSPNMSFLSFIEHVANVTDDQASGAGQHFRSQTYSLCEGDKAIPNLIGRFERLDDDWAELSSYLLEKVGLDLPPLTKECSTNGKPSYCKRGRAFALQRYKDDIRLFGYRPPLKYKIDPDHVTRGRSICNIAREAYRVARDRIDDPAVSQRLQDLMAEAFDAGKRMRAKMTESQYDDSWGA